jgi:hypothetical protein
LDAFCDLHQGRQGEKRIAYEFVRHSEWLSVHFRLGLFKWANRLPFSRADFTGLIDRFHCIKSSVNSVMERLRPKILRKQIA